MGAVRQGAIVSQRGGTLGSGGGGASCDAAFWVVVFRAAGAGAGSVGRAKECSARGPIFLASRVCGAHGESGGSGGDWRGGGAAAVLDCADSLSGDPGADSTPQPRQLHSESAVGAELLCDSLRRA